MNIKKVVSAIINQQHGWAVAEQFESTFDGEDFAEQNYHALIDIRKTIDSILNSELLNEKPEEELQDYRDALEDHIVMMMQ